jgi:hypothetical protein
MGCAFYTDNENDRREEAMRELHLIGKVLDLWREAQRGAGSDEPLTFELSPEQCQILSDALLTYYRKLNEFPSLEPGPALDPMTITAKEREASGVKKPGKLEEYIEIIIQLRKHRLTMVALSEQSGSILGRFVSYSTIKRAHSAVKKIEAYRSKRESR